MQIIALTAPKAARVRVCPQCFQNGNSRYCGVTFSFQCHTDVTKHS